MVGTMVVDSVVLKDVTMVCKWVAGLVALMAAPKVCLMVVMMVYSKAA
jgi:hypothetical protein